MATSWYLLNPPYNQVSGFEAEALEDFGQEGLLEAIDAIGVDVELCNYDLSIRQKIKAVIQNSVQDTKLKTLVRHMIVPIGTCCAGMYVYYKNRYWIIVGIVDDNNVYEKAILSICNYQLSWIGIDGKVVQRWANVASASQYNNGETATHNYFIRSDQLLITMPDDDISQMISQGLRFIIDRRCSIYERSINSDVDTSNEVITYQVTRVDSVLYNYSDSGLFEIMVTQDEQRVSDGYYVIDGKGYWLCKDAEIIMPSSNKASKICCDDSVVYIGMGATEFSSVFYDDNGNETSISPIWEIDCDFLDELEVTTVQNCILISTDNPDLINKEFALLLGGDGYQTDSISVSIKAFI